MLRDMPKFLEKIGNRWPGISRRDLFRQGGWMSAAGALSLSMETSSAAPASTGSNGSIYKAIGVRPVINSRGTFTIISGSQTLPEVKHAMDEASRSYVQMDELMQGVGSQLAQLTGA